MSDEQEQTAPKQKMRIVQFRLSDDARQYIFAEVLDEGDDELIVKRPMTLSLIPSKDYDGYSIVLHDYMPFAMDGVVSINKIQIKGACVPVREMAMYYLAYRRRAEEEKLEETLISRITDGPGPDFDTNPEFDDTPASANDTKH